MKKRFWSGLLSVVLTAAMAVTALPAAALAEDGTAAIETETTSVSTEWTLEEPELRDTEMVVVDEDYVPEGEIMQYDLPMETSENSGIDYELVLLQDLCGKIKDAILTGKSEIDIDISDITTVNANTAEQLNHIGYYCPYFDGTNVRGSITRRSTGDYVYMIVYNSLSAEESAAWINTIDKKLNALLKLVDDDSLSVADQALILHDYMAAHYYYDEPMTIFYPAIMLTQNTGVCQCYAYLFQYLMNRKGYQCYYRSSTSMSHGWNVLKIGDQYYQIDITWDDPVHDRYGQVRHDYFLVSDTTMSDSDHNHFGWDLQEYTAVDDSYEDDYFMDATSPVVLEGDLRYYICSYGLACYDTTSDSAEIAEGLSYWNVWDDSSSFYSGCYSGLWESHGKLFYNTCDQILTYDLSTETEEILQTVDTSEGYVYGCIYENGRISYALQTSPNVAHDSANISSFEYTPAHVWDSDYTIDEAATCEKAGSKSIHCQLCDEVKDTQTIPATGHSWGAGEVTKNANCTDDGEKTYTCANCNGTRTEVIPAKGHTWDEGKVTMAPTCEELGIMTFTCKACQATYTEYIDTVDHTPGTPEIENDTKDSYDLVVYCSVCLEELSRETIVVKAPTAKTLTWTGKAQQLLSAGTAGSGTMKYSLTEDGIYSETIPTAANVGIYQVYYKVDGGADYNSTSAKCVTVTIAPKKAAITSWTNTSAGIKLSWGKVTGATGYMIYKGSKKIATVAGTVTAYTDTAVKSAANGTKYTYYVQAYYKDSTGTINGAKSAAAAAYRVKAPAKFKAAAAKGYVTLSFTKPASVGYIIYRAQAKNGTYKAIKTVTGGTSYKDKAVKSGKTYYYKIRTYKTISGKKIYADYTAVKSAKAK